MPCSDNLYGSLKVRKMLYGMTPFCPQMSQMHTCQSLKETKNGSVCTLMEIMG